ncbi:MAG: D-alanine-D-alanine ligase [Candidatus Levybacteria bacterium GW2011_GWA2_40_8]|nr:MAG: D-alanine-D-alanine ligase [Candidatus Levybacteria bacterium GW2011_GWA2_40_8]
MIFKYNTEVIAFCYNWSVTKTKVAVIFGGNSTEHEVSVITGLQALENIDTDKFDSIPIYVSKQGEFFVGDGLRKIESYRDLSDFASKAQKVQPVLDENEKGFKYFSFGRSKLIEIDVFLVCFHGGLGENGGYQSLFEAMGVPYTGSGILGSSLGMDKVTAKSIFKNNDMPIVNHIWFYRNDWVKNKKNILERIEKLSYPLFVKPANTGSSIGVSKAKDLKELENAIELASIFDRKIIIEEGFEGREINISVLGNSGSTLQTSVCEEVFPSKNLLSYEDKYVQKGSRSQGMAGSNRQVPAKVDKEIQKKIESVARHAYESLDCFGLARIDFIVNEKTNKMVLLEVNTVPGSLSFYLWEASGLPYRDLLTKLIELAIQRQEDESKNTKSFPSNILENFNPGVKASKN